MSKLLRHGMTLVIDNKEVLDNGVLDGSPSVRDSYSGDGISSEDSLLESVFIAALERATQSSWRLVCMSLAAEQNEPYRTCFLSKETRDLLLLWHTWQSSDICDLPTENGVPELETFCPEKLVLNVDIYRPLESVRATYQPGAEFNHNV